MPPAVRMEGQSELIIGRGRSGKSGYGIRKVERLNPPRLLIIAPRITNPLLNKYSYFEEQIESAEELDEAISDARDNRLLLIISEVSKDHPTIWKILQDPKFRNLVILGDELAVLTSDAQSEKDFDKFIRLVGQNNQLFFGITHRLKKDINPVVPINVQRIVFIGASANKAENQILYDISNISAKMDFNEFEETLKNQPLKFPWWEKNPGEIGVFEIYS